MTQLSLFHLSQQETKLDNFVANTTSPASVFESHLRQQLGYLEENPTLKEGMRQVVLAAQGAELYPIDAFKLQGAGLVRFEQQLAFTSCELYQRYFAQLLDN